jgi:hypothetical protein
MIGKSASRTATSPPRPALSGPRRGHCEVGRGLFLRRLVSLSRDRLGSPFASARLALKLSIGRSDARRHLEDLRSCRRNSRHSGIKSRLVQNAANGTQEPEKVVLHPPVSVKKSISPGSLISMEDGKGYKSLKRHLTAKGLTPAQYREKWSLPLDYPMVAPNYAKARSDLAKGSKKRAAGVREARFAGPLGCASDAHAGGGEELKPKAPD